MTIVPIDRSDLKALLALADRVNGYEEICSKYDLSDFDPPLDGDIPRTSDGEVAVDSVVLNVGDVKVSFLTTDGEPLPRGEVARRELSLVEVDGLEPGRIRSVEFDNIDYATPGPFLVRLEIYPWSPRVLVPAWLGQAADG